MNTSHESCFCGYRSIFGPLESIGSVAHSGQKCIYGASSRASSDRHNDFHFAEMWKCGNAASRRTFRDRVGAVRKSLASEGQLITPTDSDCEAAWIAYDLGEVGDAEIVDHVSFEVMRRYSLTRTFTNDVHFQLAGFETLF